jgi:hypothetical protein
MQLNADSQQGVDAWQQYVFYVQGNSIKGQIANWQNLTTAIVCGAVDVASTPIYSGPRHIVSMSQPPDGRCYCE